MTVTRTVAKGFQLQDNPKIVCAMLDGNWLLKHTTPSWRIDNPEEGFQRMVRERRAREIALAVLDQKRTFPNAIVLATGEEEIDISEGHVGMPETIRFLIVDGQHRLWAQKFSEYEAFYGCLIHTGLSQEDMAKLFLEINDNQKRVPSSLRWDLVRLIQPQDEPHKLAAAEIVHLLATEEDSPFFQRIDLTGEQSEIQIKQGSLAPEFESLLRRRSPLAEVPFLVQYQIILELAVAIKQIDADRWGTAKSPYFKARVLRPLFRLLTDLIGPIGKQNLSDIGVMDFIPYLSRINEDNLAQDTIRSVQGSAGMAAIYQQMKADIFPN